MKHGWGLASPQTSFGVCSSRIHFSRGGENGRRNECVTNKPQRKSAGRTGWGCQQVHLQDAEIFFILKKFLSTRNYNKLTDSITFSACKLDFVCNGWKRFPLRGLHHRVNRDTKRCQISRCSKSSVWKKPYGVNIETSWAVLLHD